MSNGEPFEWLSLTEGESILWSGQPRRASVFKYAVVAVVVAAGVALVEPLYGAAVGALGLLFVGWLYLRIVNTDYVLTDRGVYRKRGVLGERVTRVSLAKVQNTDLSKGIVGAQLGFGTVSVSTAGSGGADLRIANVYDPDDVNGLLEAHAKRTEGTGMDAAGPGGDREAVERALAEARTLRRVAESLEQTLVGGDS